eukprot:scaffold15670_cov112-Isochrysis_galbana.AAC.17
MATRTANSPTTGTGPKRTLWTPPDVSQPAASTGRVAAQTTAGTSSPLERVAPRLALFGAVGCRSSNLKRVGCGGPPSAMRSTVYCLKLPGLNAKLIRASSPAVSWCVSSRTVHRAARS